MWSRVKAGQLLLVLVAAGWITAGICTVVWQLRLSRFRRLAVPLSPDAPDYSDFEAARMDFQKKQQALLAVAFVAIVAATVPLLAVMFLNN